MPESFVRNLRDLSGDIRLQSTAGTPDAAHPRTLARGARRHGEAQLAPEATVSATEAVFGHRGDWGFYTMMGRKSCPPSRARGWNRCGRSRDERIRPNGICSFTECPNWKKGGGHACV